MMNKQEFLNNIAPDMKLTKAVFMQVYGFSLYDSNFKETALKKLESVGVSKARAYYKQFTTEYEDRQREEIKRAAAWYLKTLHKKGWLKIANKEQGFTVYTDNLVQDKDFKSLSTTAKLLYLDMRRVSSCSPSGVPFEYTNTYAKKVLNISKPTYFTARDMLIEKGFIEEVRNGQKMYMSNKYLICARNRKRNG